VKQQAAAGRSRWQGGAIDHPSHRDAIFSHMTERRFVLVDFRYTTDAVGHIRLYEAGNTYDMPRALAHAAAKRNLVALRQPPSWEAPSILRSPEVLTEAELAEAEAEMKALQRHEIGVIEPEGHQIATNSGMVKRATEFEYFGSLGVRSRRSPACSRAHRRARCFLVCGGRLRL
jgi:hypothetical protein